MINKSIAQEGDPGSCAPGIWLDVPRLGEPQIG
ncbi:hypothetical protein FRACA_480039 [Frankia canadensis]|uniref:Uncharacterized protein n=1 Tax=Frankia canadensis TaxID=1836972 RepID=A0A2I2KY17_9ACTN|nr:hypothetical protein FRACA_480039 [Frankia canadensis]SOU57840.1 hypothetical protein FRACA_480039 [Frankia canadensis]